MKKKANEVLLEVAKQLGGVDVDQLPQILQKFKVEIEFMEKELKG